MAGDTFGETRLPPELQERVERELQSGEQLLWVGQPNPELFARGTRVVVVVGIIFALFALVWMVGAGVAGAWVGGPFGFMAFCGVPFLLIGILLSFAPRWTRKYAARVCYALTDRRAVIWEPNWLGGGVTVRSYTAAGLGAITRVEYDQGAGDLIFEEFSTVGANNTRTIQRRGFIGIERVREIEELLRKALLQPRAEGGGV